MRIFDILLTGPLCISRFEIHYIDGYSCFCDTLTLSWRRPLSYKTNPLLRKSMDWFLNDNGLRHERVKGKFMFPCFLLFFYWYSDWYSIFLFWYSDFFFIFFLLAASWITDDRRSLTMYFVRLLYMCWITRGHKETLGSI